MLFKSKTQALFTGSVPHFVIIVDRTRILVVLSSICGGFQSFMTLLRLPSPQKINNKILTGEFPFPGRSR